MWLMKTLLTSRCINQRGAGQNLQSVKVVKYDNYIGFKVKLAGRPATGFALYQEDNEFFLKGVINEKGLIAAENIEEEGLVFNSYYSVAFVVFNKNGVKY